MPRLALLFTDVVDSTRLAEEIGDAAMAAVWAAHDRVARDLLAPHNGREIDKTDGFLLLFDHAADAVAYALAYHRAIGALERPLLARAGLHVGAVILTENAPRDVARGAKPLEVDGLAKPMAARVMALALGGQTLVTTEAAESLGLRRVQAGPDGAVPASAEPVLLAHGHWMLKGLLAPVPLFEVGVPGVAPMTPPPDAAKAWRVVWQNEAWIPVRAVKHGLPRERDAFVGREADLQALARRLDEGTALVSILGIGGTGKTRLVLHYGWTWLGSWPGGVWFCDLSEARDAEGVVAAVARALDVPLGKEDPVVLLGHAIAGRGKCLLLLDNFEQVTRFAGETLGRWLDRAHEAQFVVTTREVLGLPGETTLALAPLLPAEAVDLFVARAVQAKRDFALTDAERPDVEALVKLLDGLPLAIELAAARVRVMPPKTLLTRMSERFKLLASSGGRHTRQATLRATLDWSWDLLTADEQQALAQVSVFEGGFTLDAAEAVLALAEAWPMDAVQALVEKSLVRQVGDDRFDLLVSVHEYAGEKLEALGGRLEAEARHGRHFASHGTREAVEALHRHGGVALRLALQRELDNLLVATRRATARADGDVALATMRAAWEVLRVRGPLALAPEPAQGVLEIPTLARQARGEAALILGGALSVVGRGAEARQQYDAALAVAREVENRAFEGVILGSLGGLHLDEGRLDEARSHFEAALVVCREVGDRRTVGGVLVNLGIACLQQGRSEEARGHYDAALAVAREIGNRRSEGLVLANLAILDFIEGRLEEARTQYEAALSLAREVGNRRTEGHVLGNLGLLHRRQGRLEEARAHYDAALAVARQVGDRRAEGHTLSELAKLSAEEGRLADARVYADAGATLLRAMGDRLELGKVLCARALVLHAEGLGDAAERDLAEAEALAAAAKAGPESQIGRDLAKARATLGAR